MIKLEFLYRVGGIASLAIIGEALKRRISGRLRDFHPNKWLELDIDESFAEHETSRQAISREKLLKFVWGEQYRALNDRVLDRLCLGYFASRLSLAAFAAVTFMVAALAYGT